MFPCTSRLPAWAWPILCLNLVPLLAATTTGEEVLIELSAQGWRFVDSRQGPEENWQSNSFDDSGWQEGHGVLGYGEQDVQTQLTYGPDPQNKHHAAFFRKRFALRDRPRLKKLFGRIRCDDGAVVYVNQQEVYRYNLPPGDVTAATLAIQAVGPDEAEERVMHAFVIDPELVVDGTNTIAVSVHQATPTSSDLAMQLELKALETDEEVAAVLKLLEAAKSNSKTAQTIVPAAAPVVRLRMPD